MENQKINNCQHNYSVTIKWSPQDGGFIATSSEFPTLSVLGNSRENALDEWKIAIRLMINVYLDDGLILPYEDVLGY